MLFSVPEDLAFADDYRLPPDPQAGDPLAAPGASGDSPNVLPQKFSQLPDFRSLADFGSLP